MSGLSLRAAIDAKCRDCGGRDGGDRHWRLHVSACPVTACPLWPVRPLASRNVPSWLAARNAEALPAGFRTLPLDASLAIIRGAGALVQAGTGDNSTAIAFQPQPTGEALP